MTDKYLLSLGGQLTGTGGQFLRNGGSICSGIYKYDVFSANRNDIELGQYCKNVKMQINNDEYVFENLFLGVHSPPKVTGFVHRIQTKGFSEKRNYYHRLILPLEKELNFHFQISQTHFNSDLGYISRSATKAIFDDSTLEINIINKSREKFYLVIDDFSKETFEKFHNKSHALIVALGYLAGYYAGNQGYYFAYSAKAMKVPSQFLFLQLRESIISSYSPIYSNPYGYIRDRETAKKYKALLRTISIDEFSLLSKKIYDSLDLSSAILLILESCVASLLFMPGGFAIALESMSDIIKGNRKLNNVPIKSKSIYKSIRNSFNEIISKHSDSITPEDLKTLQNRIEQFNQVTNPARLKAPFDILNINLNDEDLKILKTRNDLLHGRVPSLKDRIIYPTIEIIDKELYYISMKFYTLLNLIILKWIGFDNYIVNYPKIQESYTNVVLNEETFRKI
jgi:hypothetical protein